MKRCKLCYHFLLLFLLEVCIHNGVQCKERIISSLFYFYHLRNITYLWFVGKDSASIVEGFASSSSSFSLVFSLSLFAQCVGLLELWRKSFISFPFSPFFSFALECKPCQRHPFTTFLFSFPRKADMKGAFSSSLQILFEDLSFSWGSLDPFGLENPFWLILFSTHASVELHGIFRIFLTLFFPSFHPIALTFRFGRGFHMGMKISYSLVGMNL